MNRQVVVAVDGGGSKTDVAVVDIATGEVIGTSRGAGCSHHQIGIEATVAVLDEAVTAALMNAGVQPTDVVHAGCYLTSIDFDSEQVAVHAAVSTMPSPCVPMVRRRACWPSVASLAIGEVQAVWPKRCCGLPRARRTVAASRRLCAMHCFDGPDTQACTT